MRKFELVWIDSTLERDLESLDSIGSFETLVVFVLNEKMLFKNEKMKNEEIWISLNGFDTSKKSWLVVLRK